MIKCILFDRDGTLGELSDKRYPQTFQPYADIKEVFLKLKRLGYTVGIITNQASIARGTGANYDFDTEFERYQADIWKICPHDDKDGCDCRKPKSGLLLSIAKTLNISPTECMVVGDRLSDIQCAKNVSATAVLVLTGYGTTEMDAVKQIYPDTKILSSFEQIFQIL